MTPKRDPELVDRDQLILDRLHNIETKVDSLEQTTAFALRADEKRHQESVKSIFRNGLRRAQVYLAANGARTVGAIASHLGMVGPAVSRELAVLKEEGLLGIIESTGAGDMYAKKPIDHTLRVSRFLCEDYSLDKDGRPVAKRKGGSASRAKRAP